MTKYFRVVSAIKVQKSKDGRSMVKIKGTSSHELPKWIVKDKEAIDKASVEFTGEKCSHLIFDKGDNIASEAAFYGKHRFEGKDKKWFTVYVSDSENPKGPTYIIIESKKQ